MATVTGLTAARMLEIEGESVVDGDVVGGDLILTKHNGETINAGNVEGPQGPQGPAGPAAVGGIPGEIKLWSGAALPALGTYGRWVYANGAVYPNASHPLAAAHISPAWRTFAGASDPGGNNFRVPDLRGLVPAGLDAMPVDGARANRMTRSVAIVIAGRAGEETHVVTIAEMPNHGHGGGNHQHNVQAAAGAFAAGFTGVGVTGGPDSQRESEADFLTDYSGNIIAPEGGNGAHENVQPTVFVPYIVYLDG